MYTLPQIIKGIFRRTNRNLRNIKYALLSTNNRIEGRPNKYQPVLLNGNGRICFGENVSFGYTSSPSYWSGYCYIESRNSTANISIGENTWINNNLSVVAEKCSVEIGCNCLIGHHVFIVDSDFHPLSPKWRHQIGGFIKTGDVIIKDNVFIGSRVIILKNTVIGEGSVVGAGAVVSGKYPANSLIAGNPAVLIKSL